MPIGRKRQKKGYWAYESKGNRKAVQETQPLAQSETTKNRPDIQVSGRFQPRRAHFYTGLACIEVRHLFQRDRVLSLAIYFCFWPVLI